MNILARRLPGGLVTSVAAAAIGLGVVPPATAHAAGPAAGLAGGFSFGEATTSTNRLGSRIVYVEEHVGARFDSALRSSVRFVDRYTGSTMRFGRCRPGYRCIRVIQSNATHGHGAWTTSTYARRTSTIRLSSALARKNAATRRSIIDHELGHANGVTSHNGRCTSRMWPYYTCRNGRLPARTFTAPERAKLARW